MDTGIYVGNIPEAYAYEYFHKQFHKDLTSFFVVKRIGHSLRVECPMTPSIIPDTTETGWALFSGFVFMSLIINRVACLFPLQSSSVLDSLSKEIGIPEFQCIKQKAEINPLEFMKETGLLPAPGEATGYVDILRTCREIIFKEVETSSALEEQNRIEINEHFWEESDEIICKDVLCSVAQ